VVQADFKKKRQKKEQTKQPLGAALIQGRIYQPAAKAKPKE